MNRIRTATAVVVASFSVADPPKPVDPIKPDKPPVVAVRREALAWLKDNED